MSEGFARPNLQTTAQGFFPEATGTSGLRWAKKRAMAEEFPCLRAFCPFPKPPCHPGLTLWGQGQHHFAGGPSTAARLCHKAAPRVFLLGTT